MSLRAEERAGAAEVLLGAKARAGATEVLLYAKAKGLTEKKSATKMEGALNAYIAVLLKKTRLAGFGGALC